VVNHPERREVFRYSDVRVFAPGENGESRLLYRLELDNL